MCLQDKVSKAEALNGLWCATEERAARYQTEHKRKGHMLRHFDNEAVTELVGDICPNISGRCPNDDAHFRTVAASFKNLDKLVKYWEKLGKTAHNIYKRNLIHKWM